MIFSMARDASDGFIYLFWSVLWSIMLNMILGLMIYLCIQCCCSDTTQNKHRHGQNEQNILLKVQAPKYASYAKRIDERDRYY